MSAGRQVLAVAGNHLRLWWRRPLEVFFSIALSITFMLVTHRIFTVDLGGAARLGLCCDRAALEERLLMEFESRNVAVQSFASLDDARRAMDQGRILACLALTGSDPLRVQVALAGRNLLLDREVSGLLLRLAGGALGGEVENLEFELINDRYSARMMTAFTIASLLAFLLLSLAHNNFGNLWVRDWEHGTLFTLLASPAPRWVFVAGRLLSGTLLNVLNLAAALAVCRAVTPWPWPGQPALWLLVVLIQIFMASGLFFLLATVCRHYHFYASVSLFLLVILLFASGAITPLEVKPGWEQGLARLNPAFYMVRSMRAAMLDAGPVRGADLGVILAWGLALFGIGLWRLNHATIDRRG